MNNIHLYTGIWFIYSTWLSGQPCLPKLHVRRNPHLEVAALQPPNAPKPQAIKRSKTTVGKVIVLMELITGTIPRVPTCSLWKMDGKFLKILRSYPWKSSMKIHVNPNENPRSRPWKTIFHVAVINVKFSFSFFPRQEEKKHTLWIFRG